jgi:alpha-D-ribose 1-methylphosphonate 5-phosphate C-P lyase
MMDTNYNFGFLDERTKKMIRRAWQSRATKSPLAPGKCLLPMVGVPVAFK